jgi:DNA polymerase-3 subunit delta
MRRDEFAPVYYLTGDEDILKDELVTLLVDRAVDPATRDFNLDTRTASDLDAEALHTLIETPPMLAERRVVIIKSLELWRKNSKVWQVLQKYLAAPAPSTILVLVHGAGQKPDTTLTRNTTHIAVDALSPDRLIRWVNARAERAGVELQEEAVVHLIDAVGADLGHLGMELEKLAAAAEGPVDAARVAEFVGIGRGETPHDWVRAVVDRQHGRALGQLPRVLSTVGVNGVRLVTMVGTALVGVRLAYALRDTNVPNHRAEQDLLGHLRAARPMGLGSWKTEAAAWHAAARRWTGDDLDAAIQAAYAADRALKSTTIADELGILTEMLLTMSARKAAA